MSAPESPTLKGKGSFLSKRVLGVKVLYWLAVLVLVGALYAWKMQASTPAKSDAPVESPQDTGTDVPQAESYPAPSSGTVIVAPASSQPSLDNSSIETNEQWVKKGTAFLIKSGKTGTYSAEALGAYLDGAQLSTEQRAKVNMVINEYGLPPYLAPTQTVEAPQSVSNEGSVTGYAQREGPQHQAVYAVYSNQTLRWVQQAEWKQLGGPIDQLYKYPASDPIWSYPVVGQDAPMGTR
jgi:cytoskeletal protein RodZ